MDARHPDPLDTEIATVEARIVARERENEADRAELRGLKKAAQLRPLSKVNGVPPGAGRAFETPEFTFTQRAPRGKAPGTLSNKWVATMARVVAGGNPYLGPQQWSVFGQESGMPNLSPKAAHDWLRRSAANQLGFIQRSADGRVYRVGIPAIEKFGLKAAKPSPEDPGNGSA
jgi:hypothetical protein